MTDNEKAMLKTIRKYESILTDILDCGYEDLAFATSWASWPIRPRTHFKPP